MRREQDGFFDQLRIIVEELQRHVTAHRMAGQDDFLHAAFGHDAGNDGCTESQRVNPLSGSVRGSRIGQAVAGHVDYDHAVARLEGIHELIENIHRLQIPMQ